MDLDSFSVVQSNLYQDMGDYLFNHVSEFLNPNEDYFQVINALKRMTIKPQVSEVIETQGKRNNFWVSFKSKQLWQKSKN